MNKLKNEILACIKETYPLTEAEDAILKLYIVDFVNKCKNVEDVNRLMNLYKKLEYKKNEISKIEKEISYFV